MIDVDSASAADRPQLASVNPDNSERKAELKRFSWDRLIHDGQKRLATFMDTESAVSIPSSSLSQQDDLSDNDSGHGSDNGSENETNQGPNEERSPTSDVMAEVFGISSAFLSTSAASSMLSTSRDSYMAFAEASTIDTSVVAAPATATSGSTSIAVEGSIIRHGSITRYPKFGNETTIDRMRRTMRRYSDQHPKRPTEEAMQAPNSMLIDGEIADGKKLKKREKLRTKLKDGKAYIKGKQQLQNKPLTQQELPETEALTIMDKLLDKLVTTALPTASTNISSTDWRAQNLKGQPPFSIPIMTRNFRGLTSRTGVAFETIYTVQDILSWKNKWSTVGFWSIYSYLCLNPKLIPPCPFLWLAYHVMLNAYIYRHPPDTQYTPQNPIPARGPPLEDPVIPKPVPELSREFFYNVVDIQNFMVVYIDTYDLILDFLTKFAFFANNERTSSLVFVILLVTALVTYIVSPWVIWYTPWRFVFLLGGWMVAVISHPRHREKVFDPLKTELIRKREKGRRTLDRVVSSTRKHVGSPPKPADTATEDVIRKYDSSSDSEESSDSSRFDSDNDYESPSSLTGYERVWKMVNDLADNEFDLYQPQEQRQVEVFEVQCSFILRPKPTSATNSGLQRRLSINVDHEASSYHWTPSLFSSHPYLPIMRGPLLPSTGPPSLTNIKAPNQWTFLPGTAWQLDLSAHAWVQSRGVPIATGTGEVFVRVDEETKWVYDKYPVVPKTKKEDVADPRTTGGSLDGKDDKKMMYIRRRRWTRICTRQKHTRNG